jgi:hypothetical protein
VHAVGLQLIRYPCPLDWNDVNGATEERVMFLLFVQGKASGATTGIGASGVINRSSMQKIADESNGRVYAWGSWQGGKTWPIYMRLTPKPVQNRRPHRDAVIPSVTELDTMPVGDLAKAQLERLVHGLKRQRQTLLDDIATKDSIIEHKERAYWTDVYNNRRDIVPLGEGRYEDCSLQCIKEYYIRQPSFQYPDYVTLKTLPERRAAFGRNTTEKMVTEEIVWDRECAFIIYFDKLVLRVLSDEEAITKRAVQSCLDDITDVLESRVSFRCDGNGARLYAPADGKEYTYRWANLVDTNRYASTDTPDNEQQIDDRYRKRLEEVDELEDTDTSVIQYALTHKHHNLETVRKVLKYRQDHPVKANYSFRPSEKYYEG